MVIRIIMIMLETFEAYIIIHVNILRIDLAWSTDVTNHFYYI